MTGLCDLLSIYTVIFPPVSFNSISVFGATVQNEDPFFALTSGQMPGTLKSALEGK